MATSTPDTLRAPFALRCGALLIDYTLLLLPLAVASILSRTYGESGRAGRVAGESVMLFGYTVAVCLFVLNFILFSAISDRTLGKWIAGLRIECMNGERPGFMRACLRHLLGYALTLMTFGLGFLVAALRGDGRALHDFIASTIVVRERGARSRMTRRV